MFPLYFNALLKDDGSLTKNSDGSYSLVFNNVKNNVVLYQTWDGHNPTFNMIVNTSKFEIYESNLKSQLPLGKFEMTMNIDSPAPSRRGNGDESGVDGGMELTNDILDDIALL
jgi:hypothetical protein